MKPIKLLSDSGKRAIPINIEKLPLRQTMTPTTYTIQGCQFHTYRIAETNAKEFYVAFSRGKCFESLSLKSIVTQSFAAKSRPSEELLNEMKTS